MGLLAGAVVGLVVAREFGNVLVTVIAIPIIAALGWVGVSMAVGRNG